jgi:hypothetical protein
MRRTLFTLAAGLSAALGLLVAVLWVRSESHHDMLIIRLSGNRAAWAESVRGGAQFGMMTNTRPGQFSTGWRTFDRPANPFPLHTHAGFGADAAHINAAEVRCWPAFSEARRFRSGLPPSVRDGWTSSRCSSRWSSPPHHEASNLGAMGWR